MYNWIMTYWHAHLRSIDIAILWPTCKREALNNLEDARIIFTAHALSDRAWRSLGDDELRRQINALE